MNQPFLHLLSGWLFLIISWQWTCLGLSQVLQRSPTSCRWRFWLSSPVVCLRGPPTPKCVCVSRPPGLGAQGLACPLAPASVSQAVVPGARCPDPRVGSRGGVTATTPAGESSYMVLQTCCKPTGFLPRKERAVCREIGVAGLGGLVGPPPLPRPVPGAPLRRVCSRSTEGCSWTGHCGPVPLMLEAPVRPPRAGVPTFPTHRVKCPFRYT